MADSSPKPYSTDPALYLYTSLTSGSSHIVTATSRMETILKANRIPFRAIDIATDEKARMLWGRRAGKDESGRVRKIPGLVQMGLVVGDLVEVEDWNEYGELKQHVTIIPAAGTPARSAAPTPSSTPSKPPLSKEKTKLEKTTAESSKAAEATETSKPTADVAPNTVTLAMRLVGQEAAQKAKDGMKKVFGTSGAVREAPPTKKEPEHLTVVPPPLAATEPSSDRNAIDVAALMQSPTSSAWKRTPGYFDQKATPKHSIDDLESLQSPNSTAWKPTDTNLPILSHRGSSISQASAEEIRRVEEEARIAEEDEDEEDD